MHPDLIYPMLAGLALFATSTVFGVGMVKKLIQVHEARHELKRGSAGFLRSISGWSMIALWLIGVWFLSTIIGDWGATGDLDGALARSWLRLRIVLEIAAAVMDSD